MTSIIGFNTTVFIGIHVHSFQQVFLSSQGKLAADLELYSPPVAEGTLELCQVATTGLLSLAPHPYQLLQFCVDFFNVFCKPFFRPQVSIDIDLCLSQHKTAACTQQLCRSVEIRPSRRPRTHPSGGCRKAQKNGKYHRVRLHFELESAETFVVHHAQQTSTAIATPHRDSRTKAIAKL